MPVCTSEFNGSQPKSLCPFEEDHFTEMINENERVPENKTLKCANETTTTTNANSDSVVDIRRARRKYKKKLKCDKGNPFKLEWAKLSTDDSIEGPNKMNHDSLLSMNDLLHDLNRIRRVSVASSDILGDHLNRIKKCDGNGMTRRNEKNRRKSTNSFSTEAQNNAEMKSIILDPENSLHSPRQQDYALPRGKTLISFREMIIFKQLLLHCKNKLFAHCVTALLSFVHSLTLPIGPFCLYLFEFINICIWFILQTTYCEVSA